MAARRILALVLVGILGGILSGLFGVGGGIIMVPLLMALVRFDQRRASATSLAAIVPTTVVGAVTYGVAGHLDIVAGIAIAAGGVVASYGGGSNVAPTEDEPGMFGCTVPIVTGPGAADFASLLLGDPAVADRTDLDAQLGAGRFGFESDGGSGTTVRWRDCVIQLSSTAQRMATESAWVLPGEWGDGCLIGDGGTV